MRVVLVLALVACGDKLPVAELQDPATCQECHPKHYQQWSGSMHAYSSDDPVFLAMNKRGQRETNGELGDFCIQCHAPMAIQLGVATGANFDPAALPPAARGVTCYFCHNVDEVTADHNNGLVLAMDQTMRGGAKKPVDSPAHNSAYDTLMASKTNNSTMCGSCHDVTTPRGVTLERTFSEWKATIFATTDPVAFLPQTCSGCHMKPTTETIAEGDNVKSRTDGFHEHMWPAIDQALTPFPELEAQAAAVERELKSSVKIIGTRPLGSRDAMGGICVAPNGELTVRVDSLSVGHMFPSGAAQDRRMWLEVRAFRSDNSVVFESGIVPAGQDPEDISDPNLKGFWDRTFKDDNTQAHFFWDVARYDSQLIRPAVTLDPNSPLFDHSTTAKFLVASISEIDRVEAQLYVRPLAYSIFHELELTGDIDPSIKTKLETLLIGEKSIWTKATAGTGAALNTPCNPF